MNKNVLLACISLNVVIFTASVVWANGTSTRDEIIKRELDCVSQKMNQSHEIAWNDVCYTEDKPAQEIDTVKAEVKVAEEKLANVVTKTTAKAGKFFQKAGRMLGK